MFSRVVTVAIAAVAAIATSVSAGGGPDTTTARPVTTTASGGGQTHIVSWGLDVSQASITINQGDTVE
jgi:hypothetical protein